MINIPGGASFWHFGAFPVVAAAAFQLAIIYRAADSLAEFFVFQSVVAIGLSLVCLQPRTWGASLRRPSRLRWSFLLSLVFLLAVGAYFSAGPSSLGMIAGAFITKKACDIAREFVFLGELKMPPWTTAFATALETAGVLLTLAGLLTSAAGCYIVAAIVITGFSLGAVRGASWEFRWIFGEVPHAISMTLFNMGSRLFLVSVPSSAAHLVIGAMLQVVSFLSPVNFAVYARMRAWIIYLSGWALYAAAISVGAQFFVWVGGGNGVSPWLAGAFAALIAFNSSAMVWISAAASRKDRAILGLIVSLWSGVGVVLGMIDALNWEIAFLAFLLGNTAILTAFAVWRWRDLLSERTGGL